MPARHAIFFAPAPGSALDRFATAWLGRDAGSGAAVARPEVEGIPPARLAEITRSPRHYGFHATLKAPFALADGHTADQLHAEVAALASRWRPFEIDLEVSALSGFLAFTLARPSDRMTDLAAACVTDLDGFRRPPDAAELARRRGSDLTPAQDQHLVRYGYPYVLDAFRFHMTLTERLTEPERGHVSTTLRALGASVTARPVTVDALTVFTQPDRDRPFVVQARHPFAAGSAP